MKIHQVKCINTNMTTRNRYVFISDSGSSFSRKRRNKSSAVDRRHQEKMQRMDQFNDLFKTMIEKM